MSMTATTSSGLRPTLAYTVSTDTPARAATCATVVASYPLSEQQVSRRHEDPSTGATQPARRGRARCSAGA